MSVVSSARPQEEETARGVIKGVATATGQMGQDGGKELTGE